MKKIGKISNTSVLGALIFFFLSNAGFTQDIKVTTSVDRNPVGLKEQFRYEVKVSGSVQNLPDANLPDFDQFDILSGPNVSSSFQIVNFSMTATRTYTWILIPKQTGTFSIGPATVTYNNEKISSNAINLTVSNQSTQNQQPAVSPPQSNQQTPSNVDLSKSVFIRAVPSSRTVFQNEEVTIRYKLYFRQRITNNELVKLPEAVGCWVEEYPIAQRPAITTEVLNGVQYNVAEIRKVAVFPSRPGKITISPMILKVETLLPRRRSRDLFEDFFSDPFGQTVATQLNSGEVNLTVRMLPTQGKPADFSGLVGDFKLRSSIDKKEVRTNEAISYKINISGKGILKILNTLPFDFPPNFEVFEPKISESVDKNGAYISCQKEYEYVFIPRIVGVQKIKPFNISYFNPQDKQYHYLDVPEYVLDVLPGSELAVSFGSGANLSKEEVQLLGKDIRFIKEAVPNFSPIGKLPYQNWWFYLSFVFPLALLSVAWGYRNHLEKMSSNIQYARSRKAQQQARSRLKKANVYLKQEQTKEFYTEISNALVGYVADKTNQSGAGLLRDDINEILDNYNVDAVLKTDFMKCLDAADFNRFAPGSKSTVDMDVFYKEAEKNLVNLSKYF